MLSWNNAGGEEGGAFKDVVYVYHQEVDKGIHGRVTEDKTAWRKISCAAGEANVRRSELMVRTKVSN